MRRNTSSGCCKTCCSNRVIDWAMSFWSLCKTLAMTSSFSHFHSRSIGFNCGEYGGKKIKWKVVPFSLSRNARTILAWWIRALSNTSTMNRFAYFSFNRCKKSRNVMKHDEIRRPLVARRLRQKWTRERGDRSPDLFLIAYFCPCRTKRLIGTNMRLIDMKKNDFVRD